MNPGNEPIVSRTTAEALRQLRQETEYALNRAMTQRIRSAERIFEEEFDMQDEMFLGKTTSNNKKRMKERHFNQEERQANHNPGNDWCESKRGEKCYNSVSLEVADIISKHEVKAGSSIGVTP